MPDFRLFLRLFGYRRLLYSGIVNAMPRPSDQFPRTVLSHAARLEVAPQRAGGRRRRSEQGSHAKSGIGCKDGNPSARAEEPASQIAVSFERPRRATSHLECHGHSNRPCVPKRSSRYRRCCERAGRKVWAMGRVDRFCRANFERCIAHTGERPTTDCWRNFTFSNCDCGPSRATVGEDFCKERSQPTCQTGSGTSRIFWRRANARPLALETTGHARGPGRESCSNREGSS